MPLSPDELAQAVAILAYYMQKAGTDYSISGGAAGSLLRQHYDLPTRTTDDIDLVIKPSGNTNAETLSAWLYTTYPDVFGKKVVYGVTLPTLKLTKDSGSPITVDIEIFDVRAWPRRPQYDLSDPDNERMTLSVAGTSVSHSALYISWSSGRRSPGFWVSCCCAGSYAAVRHGVRAERTVRVQWTLTNTFGLLGMYFQKRQRRQRHTHRMVRACCYGTSRVSRRPRDGTGGWNPALPHQPTLGAVNVELDWKNMPELQLSSRFPRCSLILRRQNKHSACTMSASNEQFYLRY